MQDSEKKNNQSGRIIKIYDEMIKQIMPLPQKPPIAGAEGTDTKPSEKSKEGEKKDLPIVLDSFP